MSGFHAIADEIIMLVVLLVGAPVCTMLFWSTPDDFADISRQAVAKLATNFSVAHIDSCENKNSANGCDDQEPNVLLRFVHFVAYRQKPDVVSNITIMTA